MREGAEDDVVDAVAVHVPDDGGAHDAVGVAVRAAPGVDVVLVAGLEPPQRGAVGVEGDDAAVVLGVPRAVQPGADDDLGHPVAGDVPDRRGAVRAGLHARVRVDAGLPHDGPGAVAGDEVAGGVRHDDEHPTVREPQLAGVVGLGPRHRRGPQAAARQAVRGRLAVRGAGCGDQAAHADGAHRGQGQAGSGTSGTGCRG